MSALREIFAFFKVSVDASALDRLEKRVSHVSQRMQEMRQDARVPTPAPEPSRQQALDPPNNEGWLEFIDNVADARQQLKGLLTAAGVTLTIAGIHQVISSVADLGRSIRHASLELGITERALQEVSHAASLYGVSQSEITSSMRQLRSRVTALRYGSADAARNFSILGVSVRDSSGALRSTDDLLYEVADGLQGAEGDTRKLAAAEALLGTAALHLLPLFEGGADGVRRMREELTELGGGMTGAGVDAAEQYHQSLARLHTAWTSIADRLAIWVLPTLARWTDGIARSVGPILQMIDKSQILQAALVVLGAIATANAAAFAAAWLAAGWPLVVAAGFVAALILAVDDFFVMLEGGQSIIGDFLDEVFGLGTAQAAVVSMHQAWSAMLDTVDQVYTAIARVASGQFRPDSQLLREYQARRDQRRAELSDTVAGIQATHTGFGGRIDQTAVVRRESGGASVQQSNNVTITIPPGSDEALIEKIRKTVADVQDEADRAAMAVVG